jgi:hypothetical protein
MGYNSVTDLAPQEIYQYLAYPTWAFKVPPPSLTASVWRRCGSNRSNSPLTTP